MEDSVSSIISEMITLHSSSCLSTTNMIDSRAGDSPRGKCWYLLGSKVFPEIRIFNEDFCKFVHKPGVNGAVCGLYSVSYMCRFVICHIHTAFSVGHHPKQSLLTQPWLLLLLLWPTERALSSVTEIKLLSHWVHPS